MADLDVMRSANGLSLDLADICAEMVDHTDGGSVLRVFLTGLFLVDRVVLPRRCD